MTWVLIIACLALLQGHFEPSSYKSLCESTELNNNMRIYNHICSPAKLHTHKKKTKKVHMHIQNKNKRLW